MEKDVVALLRGHKDGAGQAKRTGGAPRGPMTSYVNMYQANPGRILDQIRFNSIEIDVERGQCRWGSVAARSGTVDPDLAAM